VNSGNRQKALQKREKEGRRTRGKGKYLATTSIRGVRKGEERVHLVLQHLKGMATLGLFGEFERGKKKGVGSP